MKEKHNKYGELKSERLATRLTPTGKEKLEALAGKLDCSVSELLEQIARGEISPQPSLGESSLS